MAMETVLQTYFLCLFTSTFPPYCGRKYSSELGSLSESVTVGIEFPIIILTMLCIIKSMAICSKLNSFITFLVINLATLWFILIVLLSHPHKIGKHMEKVNQLPNVKLLAIHIHNTPLDLNSLQLLEVINQEVPNVLGDKAILVISCEWLGKDYIHFLHGLSKSKQKVNNFKLPIFLLQQTSNNNFYNHRTLLAHSKNLWNIIAHCLEIQNIRKLTIMAYQEGALLTLLALSQANWSLIQRIDKVILINALNPKQTLFQNDPKAILRHIKRNLLAQPQRLAQFHKLRIILINTFRTVYPQDPQVRNYFNFAFEDIDNQHYQLNSTLSISSKSIWNVERELQRQQYFNYEPFTNMLLKLFTEDNEEHMSIESVEYLLRYRQTNIQKKMSEQNHRRYIQLGKCTTLHLQSSFLESKFELMLDCIRMTIRQRYMFIDSVLICDSQVRFDIYGDRGQKINPTQSRSGEQHIYLITNLQNTNELILINPSKKRVTCRLSVIHTPNKHALQLLPSSEPMQKGLVAQQIGVIESCEGWRPIIGISRLSQFQSLMEWSQGNCYIELLVDHNMYPEWFNYNWQVVRNIIIFTLFSSTILGKITVSRFYTQFVLNLIIFTFVLHRYLLFETLIVTCTAASIELISMLFVKVSQFLPDGGRFYWIAILFPLLTQILPNRSLIIQMMGGPSKVLLVQVLLINSQRGYLITIIKCYFMFDIYRTEQPPILSLLLLALWQIIQSSNFHFSFNTAMASAKRRLADIIFILMLCMSLSEQASVIHQLINFYMITHLLLIGGQIANLCFQKL